MDCRYFVSAVAVLALIAIPTSHSVPLILIHGIADECSSNTVNNITQHLKEFSNVEGYCVEVGNGVWDSWFMPLSKQADIVCEKVKGMKQLQQGYNIVGISQANLAPSGLLKLPDDIPNYLEKCSYLPKLNNELPDRRNATYKARFTSLQNLVLIMFEQDDVLKPRETSWFGYYPDGAFEPVLSPEETKLYTEDWIGLKTLVDAGKVKFISVPGNHVAITISVMKEHIVPYLVDQSSKNDQPSGSKLMIELVEDKELSHMAS